MASSRIHLSIGEPTGPARPAARRFALFALGFRPFYLLGSAFAAFAIVAWTGAMRGFFWDGALDAFSWHQHEMLFGFALAIITGFLLTAGRAWTRLETLKGVPLAVLAVHWLLARVLMYFGPTVVAAIVDVAFPLVLAVVLARVILRSQNHNNLAVCGVLVLLAVTDAAFFLEHAGTLAIAPGKSAIAALYLIVMLVTLIGGRVIPSFTANAVRGVRVIRSARVDLAATVLTLGAFIAALLGLPAWVVSSLAAAAAVAQAVRLLGWKPLATVKQPLLWVLHLSYAWIPAGLALLALNAYGVVSAGASVHAFSVGTIGGMILAMVTRTALGHTGRLLVAGRAETAAYVLVHMAAGLRLMAAFASDTAYTRLIEASAALWCAAFLIYFATYLPRLLTSRVDAKPG